MESEGEPVSLEEALDGLTTASIYAEQQGESELAQEIFEIYQQVAAFLGSEEDWEELDEEGREQAIEDLRDTYLFDEEDEE